MSYTAPLRDDPAFVLDMYDEAKELVAEIRTALQHGQAMLAPDLAERVEDFHTDTFLDTCTTLGPDCGCNNKYVSPYSETGAGPEMTDEMLDRAAAAYQFGVFPGDESAATDEEIREMARAVVAAVLKPKEKQ